jgi:hypothetical protein
MCFWVKIVQGIYEVKIESFNEIVSEGIQSETVNGPLERIIYPIENQTYFALIIRNHNLIKFTKSLWDC